MSKTLREYIVMEVYREIQKRRKVNKRTQKRIDKINRRKFNDFSTNTDVKQVY